MSSNYNDDEIIVRPAKKEDMAAVAEMIKELADFEKMPDGPKISAEDLARDFSSSQFRCVVASLRGSVAGYALFFPIYSTWQGRSMQLEDLYVRPQHRRHGIGELLFKEVAKEAVLWGSSRLDFHVLRWNEARAFYARRGARDLTADEDWCYYRLADQALLDLSQKDSKTAQEKI